MRRLEHMQKQYIDVVIRNNRTFSFDGFNDAAASPGIEPLKFLVASKRIDVIGTPLEHLHKNSTSPGARKIQKNDLQQSLKNMPKTIASAKTGRILEAPREPPRYSDA